MGVISRALETMRDQLGFVAGADFNGQVLLPADMSNSHARVSVRAGGAGNRRKWTARGTAHDELQVAVAYLRYGGSSSVHIRSSRGLVALARFREVAC